MELSMLLIFFFGYVISTLAYWGWMLIRMPAMKFGNWKQRLVFSAIVLKAAALWPVSMAVKLWDRLVRQG